MSDRLERDLRALAVAPWPATPDLAAAVARALAEPTPRRARRVAAPGRGDRRWRWPCSSLGSLAAVEPVRSAVLDAARAAGARIERREPVVQRGRARGSTSGAA